MKCLKAKYVKTRKEQKCFGCCRKFPPKTNMYHTVCIDDSGIGATYWCDICKEEVETWPEWTDEGVHEGDVIDIKPELFVYSWEDNAES
jgi:hypothetical protein